MQRRQRRSRVSQFVPAPRSGRSAAILRSMRTVRLAERLALAGFVRGVTLEKFEALPAREQQRFAEAEGLEPADLAEARAWLKQYAELAGRARV